MVLGSTRPYTSQFLFRVYVVQWVSLVNAWHLKGSDQLRATHARSSRGSRSSIAQILGRRRTRITISLTKRARARLTKSSLASRPATVSLYGKAVARARRAFMQTISHIQCSMFSWITYESRDLRYLMKIALSYFIRYNSVDSVSGLIRHTLCEYECQAQLQPATMTSSMSDVDCFCRMAQDTDTTDTGEV